MAATWVSKIGMRDEARRGPDDLEVLARGVEHLDHALVGHQLVERRRDRCPAQGDRRCASSSGPASWMRHSRGQKVCSRMNFGVDRRQRSCLPSRLQASAKSASVRINEVIARTDFGRSMPIGELCAEGKGLTAQISGGTPTGTARFSLGSGRARLVGVWLDDGARCATVRRLLPGSVTVLRRMLLCRRRSRLRAINREVCLPQRRDHRDGRDNGDDRHRPGAATGCARDRPGGVCAWFDSLC